MIEKYKIIPEKLPIIDFFKDDYRQFKNSLRMKEFIYIEQFLYLGSFAIKKQDEHNKLFREKLSRWWPRIKDYITTNGS